MKGPLMGTVRVVFAMLGAVTGHHIPIVESGERHLWLGTSGRFPAKDGDEKVEGIVAEAWARGTDAHPGSGVYSVDENGESAPARVEDLLAGFRKDGTSENVWGDTEAEFRRITGTLAQV